MYVNCNAQNRACSLSNFISIATHGFSLGFTPPFGTLQPSGYQTPPPQPLYSDGEGPQLTFTPPHLPQQSMS